MQVHKGNTEHDGGSDEDLEKEKSVEEKEEFEDLLGSGALLKKTIREGSGRKPDHGAHVWVTYSLYEWCPETNSRKDGPPLDQVENDEVVIGDDDYRISGIELVVRLLRLGERAIVRLDPRFGYAAHAKPANIEDNPHLEVDLELVKVSSYGSVFAGIKLEIIWRARRFLSFPRAFFLCSRLTKSVR